MVLIVVSWIYIVFTTITIGFYTNKLLKLNNRSLIVNSIIGLFVVTILATVWALFGRLHCEFHIFLLCITSYLFHKFKKQICLSFLVFLKEISKLEVHLKIITSTVTVLIIAQCASIPYVLDNESYYIQSIKWINEYGLVKGLGNLHLFLAQTSGWHILQSALNFSFLYDNFNDISGYCLLLGNIFSILKLNEYYKKKEIETLVIGLLPLGNLFFFQFISAPSPDIAIYILSYIIFYLFLKHYRNLTIEHFNLIVIFVLFSIFIKTTAIILLSFPILLLLTNFKKLINKLFPSILVSLVILMLFILKNSIVSGYPFFPILNFNFLKTDYQIPEIIAKYYFQQTKLYGFFITASEYDKLSFWELCMHWLSLPKLHGLFNKWSVILLLLIPFLIHKFCNKKEFWFLYVMMSLQLGLLLITSPQYRFYFNFLSLFTFFILALLLHKTRYISLFLCGSILIIGFVVFVPMHVGIFTKNKFTLTTSTFSIEYIVFPHNNTKSTTQFELIQDGNLRYFSPIENDFFWGSGDGKLPCVNKNQIEYFHYFYNVKPQMRSTKLQDGFYSKPSSKDQP